MRLNIKSKITIKKSIIPKEYILLRIISNNNPRLVGTVINDEIIKNQVKNEMQQLKTNIKCVK